MSLHSIFGHDNSYFVCHSLWQVALGYYSQCPTQGRYANSLAPRLYSSMPGRKTGGQSVSLCALHYVQALYGTTC